MAVYTQAFAQAQDRLWQMELKRRVASGRLSEVFGNETIALDEEALTRGFREVSEHIWTNKLISDEQSRLYQAFADGVNDFLEGIGFYHDEITAFYLPPHFK